MPIGFRGSDSDVPAGGASTSSTLVIPAGAQVGDVVLVGIGLSATTLGDPSISGGDAGGTWTALGAGAVDDVSLRTRVWRRTVVSGDAGATVTVSWTTGGKAVALLWCGEGIDGANPIDTHATEVEAGTDTTHDAPSVTPSGPGRWVVHMVFDRHSTALTDIATPGGWTEREEALGTGGGQVNGVLADSGAAVPASPTGGVTYTFNSTSSANAVGWAIALNPAALTVSVGQAVEIDTAQPVTGRAVATLGQATETDTAGVVTPVQAQIVAVGQAVETDTATPLTGRAVATLGQAVETDTAGAVSVPPPPAPVVYPTPWDWAAAQRPLYRYVFADLLTDQTMGELDLTGVTYDRRIIQPGTFRATIPIPSEEVARKAQRIFPRDESDRSRGEGRTVVHVYRGADIWGTYIIWQTVLAGDERGRITVQLQGATLESYLYQREVRTDLTFTQDDQLDIARALLGEMATRPEGDVGLVLAAGTSGVLRDHTYRRSEAATYGQRLEELAARLDGFEYLIRTYVAGGQRVREWVPGYPRLGQVEVDHVFTQPGNVLSWSYTGDALMGATSWQTRGETVEGDLTVDSEPLMSDPVDADAYLTAGWPLLDKTVDYSSVRVKATLDAYAAWWAATRAGSVRIPQVSVRLPAQTGFTPNRLGDFARLALVNEWFPVVDGRPTMSRDWRVIGMEVTPPERGDDVEAVKLIFEEEVIV